MAQANALANLAAGSDVIVFAIPGSGPFTIQPTSSLPTITDRVVIDATTQPGYAGAPLIELSGSSAGAGTVGLRIAGGSSTVKGLAVNRFGGYGIEITTAGGNQILGNFIGTDVTGTAAAGNGNYGVSATTANNRIGGSGAGEGNLISGNLGGGVRLAGAGATGNVVQGNRIGTDLSGTAALGNKLAGVAISGDNNLVGGAAVEEGNVLSANGQQGVLLYGANNRVFGNLIGTNISGTSALANKDYGVVVYGTGMQIGGAAAGQQGNVISGNRYGGILLRGTGNLVQHNLIGTDRNGLAGVGNTLTGVAVDASGNTVGGVGEAGNVISGNDREGISLYKPGNFVYGNLIGTDRTGLTALGNGGWGMYIVTYDCQVGGVGAGQEGNVISGNGAGGIQLYGSGAHENTIQGNWIGVDEAGTRALGNQGIGLFLNRAWSNTVGGGEAGAGNVISANTREGIWISGDPATNNVLVGNRVGTNAAGTAALGNASHGIYITARGNRIGGTTAEERNLISGNTGSGLVLSGATARLNVIQGNRIGTDANGTAALGNGGSGVLVSGSDNTLGGGGGGAGNVISGNQVDGVQIYGTGNRVQGNVIGLDAALLGALGNKYGVVLYGSGNTIGGMGIGEGNRIAHNQQAGILVTGSGAINNAMTRNSLWSNGGLGIDLAPLGMTPNDAGDPDTGPNRLQNFPVISSAVLSGGNLTITYVVDSATGNSSYPLVIDVYRTDAAGQEGASYLATDTYVAAVAQISRTVTLAVSGLSVNQRIVATATDALGNTSEFSASVVVASSLLAPAEVQRESASATLDAADLTPLVWQAIAAWESAGLDAASVAALQSLSFEVADLPGRYLGWATRDRIVLDIDAAGYGWYVADARGVVSDEFEISDLKSQMDLLTAVMHEMGHVLGLADLVGEDDLMAGVLQPGVRHLPTLNDVDQVFFGSDWFD